MDKMTKMKLSLFTTMVMSCLLLFTAYQLDPDGNWTKYLDADNKSLVKENMDRCDNVTFLGERSFEFSWQPVVQNQSFVLLWAHRQQGWQKNDQTVRHIEE